MTPHDTAVAGLPLSTLAFLRSHFLGELGAATCRQWADDMLGTGCFSDTLVEMALLSDHEHDRARRMLVPALRDAGIEVDPPWRFALTFFRLQIQAYLRSELSTGEFCAEFERCMNFGPGIEGMPDRWAEVLRDLFDVVTLYTPLAKDRDQYPALTDETAVADSARKAGEALAS